MKAHTPFTLGRTTKQRREKAVWLNLLLCCWALHRHFGFGSERLVRFLDAFQKATHEIAEIKHGAATNRTWQDELLHWANSMGLSGTIGGGAK